MGKQKQNKEYLQQMDGFIHSFKTLTKESEHENNSLHTKVNELQVLKKNINSVKNGLLWKFAIKKTINSLPFQSNNKSINSYLETKAEMIMSNLIECTHQIDATLLALQSKEPTWSTQPLSFFLSILPRFWKRITSEYPSFDKELRFIIMYHSSFKHLNIPSIIVRWVRIMLNMAQKQGSNMAVFTLRCIDDDFVLELSINGEPWSLDLIASIQEAAKLNYLNMDMALLKTRKYGMQPAALFGSVHQMGGHCAIRRIIGRKKPNTINKRLYCQWPLHKFNPDFDFEKWQEKNGNKKYETKEVSDAGLISI